MKVRTFIAILVGISASITPFLGYLLYCVMEKSSCSLDGLSSSIIITCSFLVIGQGGLSLYLWDD